MTRILLAIYFSASAAIAGGEQAPNEDLTARVEYTLKTVRTRDPDLGGPRDKVSVSVWIPDGLKTLRGGICNPFSKGDDVGKHWQAACRHWQFAYVQVDFDAVKKEEFILLAPV